MGASSSQEIDNVVDKANIQLPPMVLCVESLFIPASKKQEQEPEFEPTQEGKSPRGGSTPSKADLMNESLSLMVMLDDVMVTGGYVTRFPSGPIVLPPTGRCSRLSLRVLLGGMPGDENMPAEGNGIDLVQGIAELGLSVSVMQLAYFGAPLYSSLWLGLAAFGQDPGLFGALERACLPDTPKVKLTLFEKATLHMSRPENLDVPALAPRPDLLRSLNVGRMDDEMNCFRGAPAASSSMGSPRSMGGPPKKTECVEGMMRCLDQSNNMIATFQEVLKDDQRLAHAGDCKEVQKLRDEVERLKQPCQDDIRRRVMDQLHCKERDDALEQMSKELAAAREAQAILQQELHNQSEQIVQAEQKAKQYYDQCTVLKNKLDEALQNHEDELTRKMAEQKVQKEMHRQTIVDLRNQMESTIEMATKDNANHVQEKQRLCEDLMQYKTLCGQLRVQLDEAVQKQAEIELKSAEKLGACLEEWKQAEEHVRLKKEAEKSAAVEKAVQDAVDQRLLEEELQRKHAYEDRAKALKLGAEQRASAARTVAQEAVKSEKQRQQKQNEEEDARGAEEVKKQQEHIENLKIRMQAFKQRNANTPKKQRGGDHAVEMSQQEPQPQVRDN